MKKLVYINNNSFIDMLLYKNHININSQINNINYTSYIDIVKINFLNYFNITYKKNYFFIKS
jgi:hypothetical protein